MTNTTTGGSIWDNTATIVTQAVGDILTELQTGVAIGVQTITLTTFQYLPGTNSIEVFVNGLKIPNSQITELSQTQYKLPAPLTAISNVETIATVKNTGTIDTVLRQDLANATDPAKGAALLSYTQPFSGAVARTQYQKDQETLSAGDFGVIADRATDDTGHISNLIAARGTNTGAYQKVAEVSTFNNDHGVDIGSTLVELGSGVMNPKADKTAVIFGQEYLQAFHAKFAGESGSNSGTSVANKIITYSGDSTVLGVGSTASRDPCTLLQYSSYLRGYGNVTVNNKGQSGAATVDWNNTFVTGDIATNPDLLILRWGINDPFYGYTIEQFLTALDSGLAKVRAARTIAQTSIIIMSSSTTNDKATGRDEVWHERIATIYRAMARKYQCCFIDTYATFQDSHNAATYMDTQANGSHVHPLDVLYEKMNCLLAEVVFPAHYVFARGNNFLNYVASTGPLPDTNDNPQSLLVGQTYQRYLQSAPGSLNGRLLTYRSPNQEAFQLNHALPGTSAGVGFRGRVFYNGIYSPDNTNKTFLGAPIALPTNNGWGILGGASAPPKYQTSLSGRCFLEGVLSIGTTTDNTVIATVPSWAAPKSGNHFAIARNSANSFSLITVNASGQLTIQLSPTTAGSWVSLDGINWSMDLA